jgi:hypothetical protein
MRFSATCQTETPQPINIKFRTIDNIGEVTVPDIPKMVGIGWLRATPQVSEMKSQALFSLLYLTIYSDLTC